MKPIAYKSMHLAEIYYIWKNDQTYYYENISRPYPQILGLAEADDWIRRHNIFKEVT